MSKTKFTACTMLLMFVVSVLFGCCAYADNSAAAVIEDIPTVQAFLDEAVNEEDAAAIISAGINAPSSMNGQPWHFSVITDKDVLQEIAGGMSFGGPGGMTPPADMKMPDGMQKPDGLPEMPGGMPDGVPAAPGGLGAKAGIADAPLVIVVSCKTGSELDAGLATQNMSAMAQLLGYGTKIISSPTIALNGEKQTEYRELLGIPEDMTAVCVLLVGKTDTENADTVSGATERKAVDEVVSYIK